MQVALREKLEKLADHYGSSALTEAEVGYLRGIRQLIDAILANRYTFKEFVELLDHDIRLLMRHHLNLEEDLVEHEFFQLFDDLGALANDEENLLPKTGNVSESERDLLHNFAGMIAFALRNSVGFHFPIGILWHDIGEIQRFGGLEGAVAHCFEPQAASWARLDASAWAEGEYE